MSTHSQLPRSLDLGRITWVSSDVQGQRWHHLENTNEGILGCLVNAVRVPCEGKTNYFYYLREHLDSYRWWISMRLQDSCGKMNTIYIYIYIYIYNQLPQEQSESPQGFGWSFHIPLLKPFAWSCLCMLPQRAVLKTSRVDSSDVRKREKKIKWCGDSTCPFSPWEHIYHQLCYNRHLCSKNHCTMLKSYNRNWACGINGA